MRRKCIFLEHLFPFGWAGVADTKGFKDLRFLIIFGVSPIPAKLCKKTLEKAFISPFLPLVSLHSSKSFNFIMKNKVHNFIFMKWLSNSVTQGDDSIQGCRLEKMFVLQKPHNREFSWTLYSPIPKRSCATGMTSWEGHILTLFIGTNWVYRDALFHNHASSAEMLMGSVQWWSLSLN